jgi:hypothetical protein
VLEESLQSCDSTAGWLSTLYSTTVIYRENLIIRLLCLQMTRLQAGNLGNVVRFPARTKKNFFRLYWGLFPTVKAAGT